MRVVGDAKLLLVRRSAQKLLKSFSLLFFLTLNSLSVLWELANQASTIYEKLFGMKWKAMTMRIWKLCKWIFSPTSNTLNKQDIYSFEGFVETTNFKFSISFRMIENSKIQKPSSTQYNCVAVEILINVYRTEIFWSSEKWREWGKRTQIIRPTTFSFIGTTQKNSSLDKREISKIFLYTFLFQCLPSVIGWREKMNNEIRGNKWIYCLFFIYNIKLMPIIWFLNESNKKHFLSYLLWQSFRDGISSSSFTQFIPEFSDYDYVFNVLLGIWDCDIFVFYFKL